MAGLRQIAEKRYANIFRCRSVEAYSLYTYSGRREKEAVSLCAHERRFAEKYNLRIAK